MSSNLKRILIGAALAAAALALAPESVSAQMIRTDLGFSQNSIPANDDGSSSLVPLGFTINFFGKTRNSVYVNNNGNVTFDAALQTYTPFGLEGTHREIIAAFFADVDTRPAGSKLVTYGRSIINGRQAFGVNYLNVGYYNVHFDKYNSFQLILIDRSDSGPGNFDIEFNYGRISWETGDASGGVNGYGGVSASVGWSNGSGDPGTSWELPGSMIPGSFLDSAPRALIHTRYNSSTVGRYQFRARDGVIIPGLTIQTGCPVPNATVGLPYAYRLAAVGEQPPYRWAMLPDPGITSLPVTLSSTGLLSGDPKTSGLYNFTLEVTSKGEDGDVTVAKRCSLTVDPPKLSIRSACPLPQAVAGAAYSQSLNAGGGTPPYAWTLVGTTAPGLTLNSNGTLAGTPTLPGTYLFTLQAMSTDAGVDPALRQCSLVVRTSAPTPTISACPSNLATDGVPYTQTLGVSGGVAPYAWLLDGLLPTGLSMNTAGVISGIPSVVAPFTFGVRASDARGQIAAEKCTIFVSQSQLKLTPACPLPAATMGLSYNQQLRATGGSAPYAWSVSGTLPTGLKLASDGLISGTPSAAGPFLFRLVVADSQGQPAGAGCSLTVARPAYGIASCPLPPGVAGEAYAVSLTAIGGEDPYSWSLTGSLPAGLTLSTTGRVTGTPASSGAYNFTLRTLDSRGQSVSQPCGLTIDPPLPTVATDCPLPPAEVGKPYSRTMTAQGGTAPYTWYVVGSLPAGISLRSDGTLSGVPSAMGNSEFTLRGSDAQNRAMARSCSLAVSLPAPPALQLSDVPAVVPPATSNVATGVELSAAYGLPVQGEATVSVVPRTGGDVELNRADPLVRFANGQQTIRFTIPAGARKIAIPIVSSGTVASTVTFAVRNLEVSGNKLSYVPPPKAFAVLPAVPVITTACFTSKPLGIELTVTGYSTTRQLDTADVMLDGKTLSQDVKPASSDYYLNEESIRTGGAFTLTLPPISATANPSSVAFTLSNSVGKSVGKTASRCQ